MYLSFVYCTYYIIVKSKVGGRKKWSGRTSFVVPPRWRGTPASRPGHCSGLSGHTSPHTWSAQISACRWLSLAPVSDRPGIDIATSSSPDTPGRSVDSSPVCVCASSLPQISSLSSWKILPALDSENKLNLNTTEGTVYRVT